MKKIVVFGASGDVGRYFIDYLLTRKAEYQIVTVGNRKHFSIRNKISIMLMARNKKLAIIA